MNLGAIVSRSAARWPHYTALADERQRITYAELDRRTNQLANGLRMAGLDRGAHVALQAWNRVEMIEAEIAFYKGGFVKIPVNARLTIDETIHILNDSCAEAMVADAAHAGALIEHRHQVPTLRRIIVIDGQQGDLEYEAVVASGAPVPTGVLVRADEIAVLHYRGAFHNKAMLAPVVTLPAVIARGVASSLEKDERRSWDVPNLFICDGSVFVTSSAVNPSLTIQAIATRTADYIISRARSRDFFHNAASPTLQRVILSVR